MNEAQTLSQGELDLAKMLKTLQLDLDSQTYVFCSISSSHGLYVDLLSRAIAMFEEEEGTTLIVASDSLPAEPGAIAVSGEFSRLTLKVHSSLNAVGLTAAVAGALTEHGISANVVAAYFHDHIFVPKERAAQAYEVLSVFSES